MPQKIKIIIMESQELFRKSLTALLNTDAELDVVSEVTQGKELLEKLKQNEADVLLLDAQISDIEPKAVLDILRKRFPDVKVVFMSALEDMHLMSDFMSYGANSFLCKSCSVETLFTAIKLVKSEGYFFDSSTSKALLESVLKEKKTNAVFSGVKFNSRETEILIRICDGKTNKEIASSLHLSTSTIDFYKTKIYEKTKCNNVIGLLKYALRSGMVSIG